MIHRLSAHLSPILHRGNAGPPPPPIVGSGTGVSPPQTVASSTADDVYPGRLGAALYAWWRSDTGFVVAGGIVQSWADKSGNGANLTNNLAGPPDVTDNPADPLFAGAESAQMDDPTGFSLEALLTGVGAPADLPAPFTVFLAARPVQAGGGGYVVGIGASRAGVGVSPHIGPPDHVEVSAAGDLGDLGGPFIQASLASGSALTPVAAAVLFDGVASHILVWGAGLSGSATGDTGAAHMLFTSGNVALFNTGVQDDACVDASPEIFVAVGDQFATGNAARLLRYLTTAYGIAPPPLSSL